MKALPIVDLLEELVDGGVRFCQVPVFVAMDLLVFQCFHERLAGGVVPGIRFTRHAYIDAVFFQQIGVVVAGILGGFNRWSQQVDDLTMIDEPQELLQVFANRGLCADGC